MSVNKERLRDDDVDLCRQLEINMNNKIMLQKHLLQFQFLNLSFLFI